MTTRNIVFTIIAAVVIVGGGWWLIAAQPSTVDSQNSQVADAATTTNGSIDQSQPGVPNTGTTQRSTGSLRSLATQGGNFTCTIEAIDNQNHTTGVIYGASNKTRLDFQVVTKDGATVMTHTIRNGTTAYTWVEGQTVGSKTTITPNSSILPTPIGGYSTTTDSTQFSSDCHFWSPDMSEFTPPPQISFTAR